jgi:streptogramin lyase
MKIDHSLLLAAFLAMSWQSSAATLTNFAGTGEIGASGDGGWALQASLNTPFGIVRGPDNALWFADYEAGVVRRIGPDGTITTVVKGTGAYDGDNGVALGSSLKNPHELRFDRAGSLFISDTGNHVIRRYDPRTKVLTTFAGTGRPGYSGDGGAAVKAELKDPISLQFSPTGDLYVADIGNHVIRRVDKRTGVITTFAGTGKAGPTPDGSPIRGTPLNGPRSLDFDSRGNLWLVTREGNQVLRFDLENGEIQIVSGTGKKGFTGNGGSAREATLNGPKGIAIAPGGDVYLADTDNHAIRRIDVKRGTLELVAGTGEPGDGSAGDPLQTRLSHPHGVFVDTDGSVFIGDSENHRIRVIRGTRTSAP